MRMRTKTTILVLLAGTLAIPVAAQDVEEASLDTLVGAIRGNRRAMVSASLNLSEEQAAAFWPIYDRYERERMDVGVRLGNAIQSYIDNFDVMDDKTAKDLLEEALNTERDKEAVRQRYVPVFANAVPYTTILRFYQIESKLDAVLRYDLASRVPVLRETPKE
jgi:hypothetical protein